jgi:hypothetical protein
MTHSPGIINTDPDAYFGLILQLQGEHVYVVFGSIEPCSMARACNFVAAVAVVCVVFVSQRDTPEPVFITILIPPPLRLF